MSDWIRKEVHADNGGYFEPVAEMIRCKDCKHAKAYYHGEQSKLGMFTYLCLMNGYHVKENEYCSKAEMRKADGGK